MIETMGTPLDLAADVEAARVLFTPNCFSILTFNIKLFTHLDTAWGLLDGGFMYL